MSGIAGIIYPGNRQEKNEIALMLSAMSHRGNGRPHVYAFHQIHVGVTGSTLSSVQGNTLAGIDGTIHNAKEIAQQLKASGRRFVENSTAELILNAYLEWGNHFLEYIQGDFALFILDQNTECVLLARDRIGKKPLYWYRDHDYFIFASELKAILASGLVPQAVAEDAVAEYLHFGYLPQDMTLLKGVNKLLPAHYLLYNKNGSDTTQSYWSYSSYFRNQHKLSKDNLVSEVDRLFEDSVSKRLQQKESIGCLIGGGLGSASVAHYLQKSVSPDRLHALHVGFEGENMSDDRASHDVTRHLKLQEHFENITPQDILDDLVKIVWHVDEPIADPHVIATWRIAKAAQPLGTFFSGMGSDELLMGHNRYTTAERRAAISYRLLQILMPALKVSLLPLLSLFHKPAAYRILKQTRTNPWQLDFLQKDALFNDEVRSEAAPSIAGLFNPVVFLHKFHNLSQIPSTVSSFLYIDVKTRLPDYFMSQYERLMTAHQVDWQTPFLAEPLVEFLAGVPEPDKVHEKEAFFILKQLLKDVFPESFLNRPKKTRSHFLESWTTHPEIAEAFKYISKGTLVESGLISRKWVEMQLATPEKTRESFRLLWSLLVLEIWFHLYINQPIQHRPPNLTVRQLLEG